MDGVTLGVTDVDGVTDDETGTGGATLLTFCCTAPTETLASSAYEVSDELVRMLELLRSAPDDFDLVITDQTMPQLTGAQLAAAALALRPHLPILLISGYSAVIDADQAARIGVRRFLHKPIRADDLLRAIYDALNSSLAAEAAQ